MTGGEDSRAEEIQRLLHSIGDGQMHAAEELLPILYEELRELARWRLAREPPGQTLQCTALVHEAFMRLVGDDPWAQRWDNRGHFFAAAALAMRRIMIERARRRGRERHGGSRQRVPLDEGRALESEPDLDLLALDAALERLHAHDRRKHEVVMLRHFAGLSIEQTAAALGVSPATVKNDWNYARAWLHRELTKA